jgi:hypothetical protein
MIDIFPLKNGIMSGGLSPKPLRCFGFDSGVGSDRSVDSLVEQLSAD